VTHPSRFPTVVQADRGTAGVLLHEQRLALRRSDTGADPIFEEGKRVNVALAAPAFDGVQLQPGVPFSFWRTLGAPRRSLGYRHGMELRGGCVVPSMGGGLCLLSNALFRAAAELGWEIVERHGHTMEAVPSDELPWGVDATIAWPYIDLRVAVPVGDAPARLQVRVDNDELVVQVWGSAPVRRVIELVGLDDRVDVIDGQRVRTNRVERRVTEADGRTSTTVIAQNAKRLLASADLGRSCLTCALDGCAGRVTIR
jgi:vancomycin resistance protein VanW